MWRLEKTFYEQQYNSLQVDWRRKLEGDEAANSVDLSSSGGKRKWWHSGWQEGGEDKNKWDFQGRNKRLDFLGMKKPEQKEGGSDKSF